MPASRSIREVAGAMLSMIVGGTIVHAIHWATPWDRITSDPTISLVSYFGGLGLVVWWSMRRGRTAADLTILNALFVLTASPAIVVAGLACLSSARQGIDPVLTVVIAWEALALYALAAMRRERPWGRRALLATSLVEIALVALWLVKRAHAGVPLPAALVATVLLHGLRSAGALVVLGHARIRPTGAPAPSAT